MLQHNTIVKLIVFVILAAVLLAAANVLLAFRDRTNVQIGGKIVSARVADTEAERAKGLSGSSDLKEGEAMLFIFDKPERWNIWMKDMNFPIDIVWLDEGKKVIHVVRNASPDSYPETFQPRDPALYVLELPAGYTHRHTITLGTLVSF